MLGIGEPKWMNENLRAKTKDIVRQFKTRREACVNYEANKDSLLILIICDTLLMYYLEKLRC